MTVKREILLHTDFTNGFINELCEMLEDVIDEELNKGDCTDFDFIDECAQTINEIRSDGKVSIIPIISRKDFFKKLGYKKENKFKIAVAVCACAAIAFSAATQIRTENNITVAQALSGIISHFIGEEQNIEQPEHIDKSVDEFEKETLIITDISVELSSEFKTEYFIGESFSEKGIKVFADYSNGERRIVDSYSVEISEDFATKACYETVTVSLQGHSKEIEVRVIESISTKNLTSIYAVFPDGYDFTVKDADNAEFDMIQVFALYSDGSEKELTENEYSVDFESKKSLFSNSITVNISYEGCSCSFVINEE